jgi:hypothetical protein
MNGLPLVAQRVSSLKDMTLKAKLSMSDFRTASNFGIRDVRLTLGSHLLRQANREGSTYIKS